MSILRLASVGSHLQLYLLFTDKPQLILGIGGWFLLGFQPPECESVGSWFQSDRVEIRDLITGQYIGSWSGLQRLCDRRQKINWPGTHSSRKRTKYHILRRWYLRRQLALCL